MLEVMSQVFSSGENTAQAYHFLDGPSAFYMIEAPFN
jgi:hypothetical protein